MGTRYPSDTTSTMARKGGELRQEITVINVSQLSMEGQNRAIQEWGMPESTLTHLVICITPSQNIHGPDHHLTTLLSTRPSFVHYQYQQGWYDEATAIRLYRDFLRRNDPAFLVLSEVTTPMFIEVQRNEVPNPLRRRSARELWRQNS
ncbi:PREDICTED: chalcone synthase 1-like [Camelina sativa]|uniref:Chalcone synthase 1-like n=1 Tax=Camelina sativa TaxID=90675 RepID=A0ABM0W7T4_CAMSA|nr:PREDICTED: chalcone synthase 1-like [Camelina sativa]